MGIYQNYEASERTMKTIENQCPRCNQPATPRGLYFNNVITMPINVKLLFIRFNVTATVKVCYCPKCGFFRIELFQN